MESPETAKLSRSSDNFEYIQTFVNPLLDESPPQRGVAKLILSRDEKPIFWLDRLLAGGFRIPKPEGGNGDSGPLVVIVSGPPGAGKSLLVQQICYCRARQCVDPLPKTETDTSGISANSVIISTEAPAESIILNLISLGYLRSICTKDIFSWTEVTSEPNTVGTNQQAIMHVYGCRQALDKSLSSANPSSAAASRMCALKLCEMVDNIVTLESNRNEFPSVVVVDSINSLPAHDARLSFFHHVLKKFRDQDNGRTSNKKPKVLIFVLDTPVNREASEDTSWQHWEYLADIVIHLDHGLGFGEHFTRTITISKARYQPHVYGPQLFKIYDWPSGTEPFKNQDKYGPRPVLREGGIFVFPSVHNILSSQRQNRWIVKNDRLDAESTESTPADDGPPQRWKAFCERVLVATAGDVQLNWVGDYLAKVKETDLKPWGEKSCEEGGGPTGCSPSRHVRWPLPYMHELTGGGMPGGRCTVLVGPRGSGRVAIGYRFLLDGALRGEHGMAISFADDPEAMEEELGKHARLNRYRGINQTNIINEKIKVLHQKPSFTTIDELLHRILFWIAAKNVSRVLITSVEQWPSAYPQLDAAPLALPAIVDTLNTHKVTSLILGAYGSGGVLEKIGLYAKADVAIECKYADIDWPGAGSAFELRPSDGSRMDGFPVGVQLACRVAAKPAVGSGVPEVPKEDSTELTSADKSSERENRSFRRGVLMSTLRSVRGGTGSGRLLLHFMRSSNAAAGKADASSGSSVILPIAIAPELECRPVV